MAVEDTRGNMLALAFDGGSYLLSTGSHGAAATASLRGAMGDEDAAWHRLTLAYVFDTGRLRVSVDGVQLGRRSIDLSDVYLRLFLEPPEAGRAGPDSPDACEVEFRDVSFRP
jgi:hypothetical protein